MMSPSTPEQDASNKARQAKDRNVVDHSREASSDDESPFGHNPTPDSSTKLTEWSLKFTKYITALEGRIKELESKVDIDVEPRSRTRRIRESTEIIQFFLVSNEPRPDRDAKQDRRWKVKDTFMSEVDDNPLVRVLYRRTGAEQDYSQEIDHQLPSPGDIDILEIRIYSKFIADFVYDTLQFDFSMHGLLHFTKPFRPLIRVFAFLKERLNKLESTHGPLQSARSSLSASVTKDARTTSPSPIEPTTAHNPMSVNTPGGLAEYHDFRNLFKFLNDYLGAKLTLYNDYINARRSKVSFENLWMLFDVGDVVYSEAKKEGYKIQHSSNSTTNYTTTAGILPQGYKILGTLGGIPLKKNPAVDFGSVEMHIPTDSQTSTLGDSKHEISPLLVFCYSLDFDGYRIVDVIDAFRFPPFDGEKDVTSLDGYPLRYKKKPTRRRDNLNQRGRAFVDLMVVRHKWYDGLAATESTEEVKGDIIIDMNLAIRDRPWYTRLSGSAMEDAWFQKASKEVMEVPKRTCNHTRCHDPSCVKDVYVDQQKRIFKDLWLDLDAKMEEHDLLRIRTEEQIDRCKAVMDRENLLVLFPGVVSGYSLRNRKWVRLDITQLQDVTYQDGWSDLVLPKGHKKMVQAMVETFATTSRLKVTKDDGEDIPEAVNRFGFDLVKQKGQGCIILLHGAPGVGKTSTAECVAAYTRRPLFPITAGDIGFSPEEIESRMQENFDLAHKWGCVLLLDEADVFLAKRNREDIKRNGLVSVFLRVLEYYSGILILTTNRVGAFDEAFHSRVHLSLFYPALNLVKSMKIFETNFRRIDRHNKDRIMRQEAPMEIEDQKIRKYWKKNYEVLKWNGRQIRNAFQTAMALADCEAREDDKSPIITVKHFETIANASVDFAKYMTMVHGHGADRIAELDRTRLGHDPKIQRGLMRVDSDSSSSESDGSVSKDVSSESSDEKEKRRRMSKKAAKEKSKKEEKGTEKLGSFKGRNWNSEYSESEGD